MYTDGRSRVEVCTSLGGSFLKNAPPKSEMISPAHLHVLGALDYLDPTRV